VASALSFIIPLLQLGILKPQTQTFTTVSVVPTLTLQDIQTLPVAAAPAAPVWTAFDYFLLAYGLITVVLVINLCIKIYKLLKLSKRNARQTNNGFILVEVEEENAAFSFLSYLFVDAKMAASETIIRHEQVHISQKHSWDIIYTELLKVINWFNPFVYLVQNSLKEIHEFIADQHTAEFENSHDNYAAFLISNAYGMQPSVLTNSFSHKNMLRKRIIMLYQQRSGRLARLKYALALPLVFGLLCLSTMAFTNKSYGMVDILPQHMQAKLKLAQFKLSKAIFKQDTAATQDDDTTKSGKETITALVLSKPDTIDTVKRKRGPIIIVNGRILSSLGKTVLDDKGKLSDKISGLADINPSDIKSISILKDRAATALYGPAAAEGVIIVTTNDYARGKLDAMNNIQSNAIPNPGITLSPPDSSTSIVFTAVEIEPAPRNGLNEFYQFLGKNIKYPAADRENRIQGRVIVQFIVEKDGSLNDIRVMRAPSPSLGEEAVRVLKLAPKWSPGIQNGRTVRVQYTIPVNFTLGDVSNFDIFYRELSQKIKYPKAARDNNIAGRVIVTFTLDDNKKIKDAQVLRGISKDIDEEVLRTMQNCKEIPGGQTGVLYTIPLHFAIIDNSTSQYVGGPDKSYTQPTYTNKANANAVRETLNEVVITSYK
jgi:TonB family protein